MSLIHFLIFSRRSETDGDQYRSEAKKLDSSLEKDLPRCSKMPSGSTRVSQVGGAPPIGSAEQLGDYTVEERASERERGAVVVCSRGREREIPRAFAQTRVSRS